MKVLIIGGGGREHALAYKAAASPDVDEVLVAPGNAGTFTEPGVRNVAVAANDIAGLLALAKREAIGLTIVGPEDPLVLGVVDAFESAGLKCFGPSRQAAQIEGSKAFMKAFLKRHAIPTAAYESFSDSAAAHAFVDQLPLPVVIKTDGLAAGKGVIIATTRAQAHQTIDAMLSGDAFGDAGRTIVIEEFLAGEEASFIAAVDGETIIPLATSQDHKTRDDGDQGPNTGGMGAYSPAPVIDDAMHERVMREVMQPTVKGMIADGHRYRGFLYAGLMIGADGTLKVLEFNCRFGDPETQPILMRLQSDLVDMCLAACEGRLQQCDLRWDTRAALGVVLAAGGYPGPYDSGKPIRGLDPQPPDSKIFHAGTAMRDGQVVTSGGRVLCAVALGDTIAKAQQRAYELAGQIEFDGCFYRRDIGHRAITRG